MGKRSGGARQKGARGGQACPTSSRCCPQVLKGLCHHGIARHGDKAGLLAPHGAGPLGEYPGAVAEPRTLLPGTGRALVLPAAPRSALSVQQGHHPPVGEHGRGTGSPLWQLGTELPEAVRGLQGPGHAA